MDAATTYLTHQAHQQRLPAKRDYTPWAVALGVALLSVTAYIITVRLDAALMWTFPDTKSHLMIARRVLISTSPGLAQLGDVWLPLPHLLMLPLIWNTTLYHNGFAGSIVSMTAYVGTAVLVYKITFGLTGKKFAGVVAAGIFAVNINMLYMQSIPMEEAVLFCTVAATVYYIQQWARTDQYRYLLAGGVAALLATLSRYESWPLVACLLAAVIVIAWQRRHGRDLSPKLRWAGTQDRFIAFAVVAMAGIVAWVGWSWAIFGSPFNFQNGPYAKASLWITANEPAIGHWVVAAKTYWYAMTDNMTWPMLLLAAIGLACFAMLELRSRASAVRALPVLSFLMMIPFFIVLLYTGQRPMHVLQINHNLYDVRFALIMLLPTAIFIGYLVGSLRHFRLRHLQYAMYAAGGVVLAFAVGLSLFMLSHHNVITYIESRKYDDPAATKVYWSQRRVVTYFQAHYKGGLVLMESFGNENIAFELPSSQLVYEGSYRQWLPALHHPAASHIAWIITRCGRKSQVGVTPTDRVCKTVTNAQLGNYKLVYETPNHLGGNYYVYRLKQGATP